MKEPQKYATTPFTIFFDAFVPNVEILGSVKITLYVYRRREIHFMANAKTRIIHLEKMMKEYPDWDWDYWVAQFE